MDDDTSRPVARFIAALRARNEMTAEFAAKLEAFSLGCRGLRLLPQGHTAETWPWWVQAFANDRGQLVVFHIAQGSADGGASLCADDDGVVLDIKADTPPDVAQFLRRVERDLELGLELDDPRDEAIAKFRVEYATEKLRLEGEIARLKAGGPSWMASVVWWSFLIVWSLVALAMIVVPPLLALYRRVPVYAMWFVALGLVLALGVFMPIYRARNGVSLLD